MTSLSIEIPGLAEIVKNIEDVSKLQYVNAAMLAGAKHIQGKVNKYPKATTANNPDNPTGRWYERTYGPRWKRKDGSIGGRKTSEDLHGQWTISERAGMEIVVGNKVSYGIYVQDEDYQADFHKKRGWKTIQTVVKDEEATVVKFITDYLDKMLK